MRLGANSKFWLAALSVLFLLLNPAGFCAGNMDGQSNGHPCCPKAPATAKAGCQCIEYQVASPTVSVPAETGTVLAVSFELPAPVIGRANLVVDSPPYSPPDRTIAFHQILV